MLAGDNAVPLPFGDDPASTPRTRPPAGSDRADGRASRGDHGGVSPSTQTTSPVPSPDAAGTTPPVARGARCMDDGTRSAPSVGNGSQGALGVDDGPQGPLSVADGPHSALGVDDGPHGTLGVGDGAERSLGVGDGPQSALGVGDVLAQVKAAIAVVFPPRRRVWVRGEIQKITESQRGHCYIDLVDQDAGGSDAPTLKVNCWRSTWAPLRALLAEQGVVLQPGTVVTLAGRIDFYAVRGQLTFVAEALDVDALIGRMAAERAALLERLRSEGLLERNKALAVPEVPLRIGLVASPRTEGCADFLGRLEGSGFAFRIVLVPVTVQGVEAPSTIAAGIAAAQAAGCDVVVLVRGGGARADLLAFDSELVARAVASSTVPVWTGIGHTGDQAVADLVAHTAWPTPTACGQALVDQVGAWWELMAQRGARLAQRAAERVAAEARHHAQRRRQLVAGARHQLLRHGDAVSGRAQRIAAGATRGTTQARVALVQRSARLAAGATGATLRQSDRVTTWQRLIAAYDVDRQLARGYSLTFDDAGNLLRRVHQVGEATTLTTRFVDGSVRSTVVADDGVAETSREQPAP